MKKKFVSVFIVSIMVCSLVACGSTTSSTTTTIDDASDTASTSGTEEITSDTDSEDNFGETLGDFAKDANIEETVLYNENGATITATGLEYDNYEVILNFKFENNSDKNLNFIAGSMGYSVNAVNEFMIEDGYLNLDVAAGETSEDSISFNYDELIIHGISEIAEIQVGFDISVEDSSDIYTGPLSVKTELADSYDYNNDGYATTIQSKALKYTYDFELEYFSQDEVYNSNGISIVSEGYMVNTEGERTLMLEVKNDSEDTVYFATSNIKVNDTVIYDSIWSYSCITSGKKKIVYISLDSVLDEDEWEETGITDIETIGFTAEVENEEFYDVAEPTDVTVTVK